MYVFNENVHNLSAKMRNAKNKFWRNPAEFAVAGEILENWLVR